jgi:hypothetical protein
MTTQHKPQPLAGAWAKHRQAAQHLQSYKDLFKDFIRSNNFAVLGSQRAGEQNPSLAPDDVWPEISCVVGDCVHNLRSALDHVAFAIGSLRLTDEQLRDLYFTIRPTRAAFDKATLRNPLPGMGADWKTFLEGVQPFQGAPYEALWALHELDKIDKHRLIFTLSARSDVSSQRADGEWNKTSMDLQDGLVRLPTGEGAFVIAAHYLSLPQIPPGTGQPRQVERDLMDFYSVVADVIRAAHAQFFSGGSA